MTSSPSSRPPHSQLSIRFASPAILASAAESSPAGSKDPMMGHHLDGPLGPPVPPGEAVYPPHARVDGKFVSLVPLSTLHAPALYEHLGGEDNMWRWTYMLSAGWPDRQACDGSVATWSVSRDPQFYAVVKTANGPAAADEETTGEAVGIMSFLSVVPSHRRIEIGSVILGDAIRASKAGTEAYALMVGTAFALGYLRVEWKANALNERSLRAAKRLGFAFEGVFRKHMVVKGRERDTAYFSITDAEWPRARRGFEAWLDEDNFDGEGRQRRRLEECREASE
ncbi:hypothetical protein RJ55_07721 [Drechmeria coniospora]|nr:hypothetical protein RJ55_07721 [Drechmeria coniospora]